MTGCQLSNPCGRVPPVPQYSEQSDLAIPAIPARWVKAAAGWELASWAKPLGGTLAPAAAFTEPVPSIFGAPHTQTAHGEFLGRSSITRAGRCAAIAAQEVPGAHSKPQHADAEVPRRFSRPRQRRRPPAPAVLLGTLRGCRAYLAYFLPSCLQGVVWCQRLHISLAVKAARRQPCWAP